jgi:hypothetical protein
MNLTSFLWGIALGVIAAFGTGFLKKAGEDFYSWAMKKMNLKASAHHTPQLVIQLNTEAGIQFAGESPTGLIEPSILERVSQLSFRDIQSAISAAPPLQRDRVAESYVGLRVEWDTYFYSGKVRDDMMTLRLRSDARMPYGNVICEVKVNEYREFGILPEDTKVRVSGKIIKASGVDVELEDVRLLIFKS